MNSPSAETSALPRRPKIEGLVAAPFTPMDHRGNLNLDAIEPYARWLQERGVVGVFVCGTTGESLSLTVKERIQVAARWAHFVAPGFRLIVHVGHNALEDARILAGHAQEIGADSIGCMPPTFFKPVSIAATADWCAEVAAAAPALPFYYYHIPSMSGVNMSVAKFLEAEGATISTLAGVKYTHEDLQDFAAASGMEEEKFDLVFGRDELLRESFEAGARGAVGSTYNFAAPLFRALMTHAAAGERDEAVRLQAKGAAMIQAIRRAGGSTIAALKATMALAGFDCGPARRPLTNLGAEEIRALHASLVALDIPRHCQWRMS